MGKIRSKKELKSSEMRFSFKDCIIVIGVFLLVTINVYIWYGMSETKTTSITTGVRDTIDAVLDDEQMKYHSSIASLILLLVSDQYKAESTWSWHCVNEKCVRNPDLTSTEDNYNTLEVCRLTCGRYGAIWPKPTGTVELSSDVIPIHPDRIVFHFDNTTGRHKQHADKLINQMSHLFLQDLRKICSPNCLPIGNTQLHVSVTFSSAEDHLTWKTDESYSLNVETKDSNLYATIRATTIFGARHGLQTLFQLTTGVSINNTGFLVMIKQASISDKPIYPHRGLLIDTSRHYLHTSTIYRTLDAMGHSKMNVLHWHATDSHSFPLKLQRVPELARYGAYSAEKVYTAQNIATIAGYAKRRGVRVLMEIDSPAHAGNGWQWGESAGLGALAVCVNQNPWRDFCIQPPCGQLNPLNPNTYKILGLLYKDLVNIFPDEKVFHMGGDEVSIPCWNSSTEITDYMNKKGAERNASNFLKLWAMFHLKAAETLDTILDTSENPIILWSSHLTSPEQIEKYLSNQKFVVQTWTQAAEDIPSQLLAKGYKIIISTKDAWYLDHGVWGRTTYYKWNQVYDNQLPEPEKGVYGGEVCMWGEYVDDAAIDARIWPRAAAAAERLWSNPSQKSAAVTYRFLHHRERLVKLGIKAEAVFPEWCYNNEDFCT